MRAAKKKLGLATELFAFAGTCIGNVLVGAGIFLLVGQNIYGALMVLLGVFALVPTYYGVRPAAELSLVHSNPVPMFLAVVHERSRNSV